MRLFNVSSRAIALLFLPFPCGIRPKLHLFIGRSGI